MGELFEVKQATLSEHINNIISSGELDETSIGFSDKSSGGRKTKIGCDYAYDCRVKTRRKRYNGESCNEFFDNVVSSWNLLFNEIGKSGFVCEKPVNKRMLICIACGNGSFEYRIELSKTRRQRLC